MRLSLEYEPEGLVEKVGDRLNIIEKRAEADLEKFKSFIEKRGGETGEWRGSVGETRSVGTPDVSTRPPRVATVARPACPAKRWRLAPR